MDIIFYGKTGYFGLPDGGWIRRGLELAMIIRFNKKSLYKFNTNNFAVLSGYTGLYFIFLDNLLIPYPYNSSPLIYIGMSESSLNSIGNRLKDHLSGRSNNQGIKGYYQKWGLSFTYLDYEFLKHVFSTIRIEPIETYFLEDFAQEYGTYPICNNKRGFAENMPNLSQKPQIEWRFFEESNDK